MITFITECSVTKVEKGFRSDILLITFLHLDVDTHFNDAQVIEKLSNESRVICKVNFSSPGGKPCVLLVNATSGLVTITLPNGEKYKSSKVMLKLHRRTRCINGNVTQYLELEAIEKRE